MSNDGLSCESLLVGQPGLQHLGIESRTLLEQQQKRLHEVSLEGFDYSTNREKLGIIGQIMMARLQNHVSVSETMMNGIKETKIAGCEN